VACTAVVLGFIDGTIGPWLHDDEIRSLIVADVLDIHVKLATSDPFSPVLHGAIQLKASLFCAPMYNCHEENHWVCTRLGDIHYVQLNLDNQRAGLIREGEKIWCMPLHINMDSNDLNYLEVYGIVLEPTGSRHEFFRCGTFIFSSRNHAS
jgi:hypothetical protein